MSIGVFKNGKLQQVAGNAGGGYEDVLAKLNELEQRIGQVESLRADLESYGLVKLSSSSAVTDSAGLAVPASELNAATEGTIANRIEKLGAGLDVFKTNLISIRVNDGNALGQPYYNRPWDVVRHEWSKLPVGMFFATIVASTQYIGIIDKQSNAYGTCITWGFESNGIILLRNYGGNWMAYNNVGDNLSFSI